jgi:hypothetical protein
MLTAAEAPSGKLLLAGSTVTATRSITERLSFPTDEPRCLFAPFRKRRGDARQDVGALVSRERLPHGGGGSVAP